MWKVDNATSRKFDRMVWWLVDLQDGQERYYPNKEINDLSDFILAEAEAELLCDMLNVRDYGRVDDVES